MKNFRKIISNTLINELGLDAVMLSRLDGDKPVCIELNDGAEIYITADDDNFILSFIEIPIRDKRKIKLQANKIMDIFIEDEDLLMNIKTDKFVVMCYIDKNSKDIENKLLDKLVNFNSVASIINNC
ncbi:hypothetical protein [Providencia rettgeri]|uniref:hypothetical protein n=1 Tax=Providencia rettgeri TaxID=587 RepID=UPI00141A12A8|nr:hypothetical protein [Providencia rettgeri]EMA4781840.1 hypothetical protein [Providencia rettgeri]NIH03999.1 hypothetical protein [Providencia rettgeri]